MDRRFLGDDAAFLACGLPLVTADHVHATDERTILLRHHGDDFAAFALIPTGHHDNPVALLDLQRRHQRTSGASEMIFIWFLARSSRVTGPKMRVPIGSPWLLTSTAALRSKRISEPSGRRTPLAVRTITALIT